MADETNQPTPTDPGELLGVVAGTRFGQPQDPGGGGVCVNKGLCRLNALVTPDHTGVTYQLDPDDPGVLVLSFSLEELTEKQADQVKYFMDDSFTYPFDGECVLDNPILAPVGLPSSARVTPKSPTTVKIIGDTVNLFITYDHD